MNHLTLWIGEPRRDVVDVLLRTGFAPFSEFKYTNSYGVLASIYDAIPRESFFPPGIKGGFVTEVSMGIGRMNLESVEYRAILETLHALLLMGDGQADALVAHGDDFILARLGGETKLNRNMQFTSDLHYELGLHGIDADLGTIYDAVDEDDEYE